MTAQPKRIHVNTRALIERDGPAGPELLIQTRDRAGETRTCIELPGGRVDVFESLFDALRREVTEETGLQILAIEGEETRSTDDDAEASVECVEPFCAYQTTRGPVDSMGLYFRCTAEGELLAEGDDTRDMRWSPVQQLASMVREGPDAFCWVDRCAIRRYLKTVHGLDTR